MKALRRLLDGLYIGAGALAALCLVAILTLIVAQMVARWTGNVFPGAASYAGYAMAGASFLAFANAMNRGSHIRVAAAVAWYFTYYAYWFVYWSWKFNEVSQDQDATALWIPQSVMVIGGGILAIALTDNLLHLIFKGDHRVTRDLVDQSFGE